MKKKDIYILGVSGSFTVNHDGAAVLIKNSKIIAAVEEERLIRVKHAPGQFPKKSIQFCLKKAGISIKEVDYLAFYVNTYTNITNDIKEYMEFQFGYCPKIKLVDHHAAHRASAYLISGFKEAKIMTIDYSGDNISTTLGYGKGRRIKCLKTFEKPNSLGIFYSLITQFLGFDMNRDEYKVMGLASYGNYRKDLKEKMDKILIVKNGEYKLDEKIFQNSVSRQQPRFTKKLKEVLGKNRLSTDPVTQREKDIAYAAQKKLEEVCLELLKNLSDKEDSRNLCLSGGVALNCVMNSALLKSEYVENIFIPPVADDPGTAFGAALHVANNLGFKFEKLQSPYLGPNYTNREIKKDLDTLKLNYEYLNDNDLINFVVERILNNEIVGWFQGRLEFGSRALGNRSILANPANLEMKDKLNRLIKFRETFRPFAPSVLEEDAEIYFKDFYKSPYMTLTFDVKTKKLPAITHVDNTARVQSVTRKGNRIYYDLIKKMKEKSGMGVVLNTSLNIMNMPIACSPKDAISVFSGTGMDILVLGNYVLRKN